MSAGYIVVIVGQGKSWFPTKEDAEAFHKKVSMEGYNAELYSENKLPKKYWHVIGGDE